MQWQAKIWKQVCLLYLCGVLSLPVTAWANVFEISQGSVNAIAKSPKSPHSCWRNYPRHVLMLLLYLCSPRNKHLQLPLERMNLVNLNNFPAVQINISSSLTESSINCSAYALDSGSTLIFFLSVKLPVAKSLLVFLNCITDFSFLRWVCLMKIFSVFKTWFSWQFAALTIRIVSPMLVNCTRN